MTRPVPALIAVGDRVRERDGVGDHVVTPASPNFHQVNSIIGHRRRGFVVDIEIKRSKTGSACKYIHVQWDHLEQPSVHASGRIEKIPD